ncbi:hypothetical protein [Sphingomonas montanisoli]|nr:hypothetical protein [Sphingomonas montanisoli]
MAWEPVVEKSPLMWQPGAMSPALNDLRQRRDQLGASYVTEDDLVRWSDIKGRFVELFDRLAVEIATLYHARQADFAFCDDVINEIYWIMADSPANEKEHYCSEKLEKVYHAFDDGEWHRRKDQSDDPVAEHTNPAIAAIIAEL